MRRCANLRSVEVQWVNSELCNNGEPKSVEQLRRDYRLDGMLDLAKLETLTLDGPGEYATGHAALQDLAKWFEAKYKHRGVKAKVILE